MSSEKPFSQSNIIIIYLIFFALGGQGCTNREKPPTLTLFSSPRMAGSSSLGWQEVWRFHTADIRAYPEEQLPRIYTTPTQIIIASLPDLPCNHDSKTVMITALTLEQGALLWQTCDDVGSYYTAIEDGYLDETRGVVYLNYGDTFINAFDLQTGARIWRSEKLQEHTGYHFDRRKVFGNDLEMLTGHNTRVTMDADTGFLLKEEPYDTDLWLSYDQVIFQLDVSGLYALNPTTKQVMWQRLETDAASLQMRLWPTFFGEDVLFLRGAPVSTLQRRNLHSGELIWGTERRVASNFVLDEADRIYFLRQDSVLVILDSTTGATLDEIAFGGLYIDSNTGPHWVMYEHPYLSVYFGDTNDLIVLRRNP